MAFNSQTKYFWWCAPHVCLQKWKLSIISFFLHLHSNVCTLYHYLLGFFIKILPCKANSVEVNTLNLLRKMIQDTLALFGPQLERISLCCLLCSEKSFRSSNKIMIFCCNFWSMDLKVWTKQSKLENLHFTEYYPKNVHSKEIEKQIIWRKMEEIHKLSPKYLKCSYA